MTHSADSNIICYHCGDSRTVKGGFNRGKQRFYCHSCRRYFRANPVVRKRGEEKSKRYSRNLPSKSHLVLQLRAIAQKLGRTPTTSDINQLSKGKRAFPLHVYYEIFGSFTEAVKRAHLKPHYKQEFDREKLTDELRFLRNKLKRPLIYKDITEAGKRGEISSGFHFQRAFGSIAKAIRAAGANRRKFTKAEIISYLNRLAKQLRKVPTGEILRKDSRRVKRRP